MKAPGHTLTKRELTKIREILPYNWRQLLSEQTDTITVRQISNVFSQNTKNPADNVTVWGYVNTILEGAGELDLAARVQTRLSFYTLLCNGTHQTVN